MEHELDDKVEDRVGSTDEDLDDKREERKGKLSECLVVPPRPPAVTAAPRTARQVLRKTVAVARQKTRCPKRWPHLPASKRRRT